MIPNIVFIAADQLSAKWIGCYGSGVPSTPTLDRLAGEGVRFDRCYATHPVCAPNRATMLTGRCKEAHGVIFNNYVLDSDNPTYAHVLRTHGYRTGLFGKLHQTPMSRPPPVDLQYLGFDESVVSEDPKWGPWIDWISRNHPQHLDAALTMTNGHASRRDYGDDPARWTMDRRQGATDEQVRRKAMAYGRIMRPLLADSPWDRMYPSPLPPEAHDSTFITDMGLDFIQRHAQRFPDKPFFCHISYVDPHDPYDPPQPYASMFRPEDMPDALPAEFLYQGPVYLDALRDNYLHFRQICDNPQAVRRFRALYHGSLRFMDDQIARIVAHLRCSGLWENTVLVFTADHGEMLGDHGLVTKGKMHYDACIRVPLLVAGGPIARGATDRLTCTLDFFPTFCDWANTPAADLPPLEGRSFASVCRGQPDTNPWPEVRVSVSGTHSVITDDRWRLTFFTPTMEGQLFNLAEDPSEQRNLYAAPAFAGKKVELMERLLRAADMCSSLPQYRNIPVEGGCKRIPPPYAGPTRIPLYAAPRSPWLTSSDKPKPASPPLDKLLTLPSKDVLYPEV